MASCPICCGEQLLLSFPSQRFLCLLLVLSSTLPNPSSLASWDHFSLVYDDSCYSLFTILPVGPLLFQNREKIIPADTLAAECSRFTSNTPVHVPQNEMCLFFWCYFVLLTHFLPETRLSSFLSAAGPSLFSL